MKDRAPSLIALVLLLVLVSGTWWAADYAQRSIATDPPRRVTHEPDSWAYDFVMIRTDPSGVAANRLEGTEMQHFPDDDSYEITTAKATGQRPGTPVTVGTSNIAVMDQDGARIIMKGDAHVHRFADEERPALDVRSDQLTLRPDDNLVFTDLPARVVNGKSTMNGTGMRYDNNTRQLQIFSASDVKLSGQDRQSQSAVQPSSPPGKP